MRTAQECQGHRLLCGLNNFVAIFLTRAHPIVVMSILAKLLIAVCVVLLLSVVIERPQAQQITQQQTQRPRRVTGTEQTTTILNGV